LWGCVLFCVSELLDLEFDELAKGAVESKVIPFYQSLILDTEHEVRSNALEQLGTLARILSDTFNDK
jgi:hypothetical protein